MCLYAIYLLAQTGAISQEETSMNRVSTGLPVLVAGGGIAALPRRSRSPAKDSPSKCWGRHHAIEALLAADAHRGDFCFGRAPTLADVYLIPQVESARRFKVDMGRWTLIA